MIKRNGYILKENNSEMETIASLHTGGRFLKERVVTIFKGLKF